MNLTIYDALARSRLLHDLERAFRDATGLSLKLVRSDEPLRRIALGSRENAFCALMDAGNRACEACMEIRRELKRRLDRNSETQELCCFAGMTEVAVRVMVGDRHVATLLAGQVFRKKPRRSQFNRLARQLRKWGMLTRLSQVEAAYRRTPVVSVRQFRGAVRLLEIMAAQLAEFANRCLLAARGDDLPAVARAKEFICAHAHERVSLRQIVQHVHLSRHYFCEMFKKATAMTFTEFTARVRVENAKNLLSSPRLRISEAAYRAGFNSISQFNRVFQRYAGRSPTAYRAALQVQARQSG